MGKTEKISLLPSIWIPLAILIIVILLFYLVLMKNNFLKILFCIFLLVLLTKYCRNNLTLM